MRTFGLSIVAAASVAVAASPFSSAFANARHGAWGPLHSWPIMPIHSVVTRDGRLLTFGTDTNGDQTGSLVFNVWDPKLGTGPGAHTTLQNETQTDIFCAGMLNLPRSGNVVTVGGDDSLLNSNGSTEAVSVFLPSADRLVHGPSMQWKRWYPTAVVMPDDRIFVHGGRLIESTGEPAGTPEVFDPAISGPNGSWRALTGASRPLSYSDNQARWFYPRSWVAPNGRIFTITGAHHFWTNPYGNGQIYQIADLNSNFTSILASSTAAMYGRGKIMQTGGGFGEFNASKQVILIDINSGKAKFSFAPDAKRRRHWGDSTILPNGQILINGGSQADQLISQGVVGYHPEIWDPARVRSTIMQAPERRARLYHSTSTLLPDGRVLSAGGGTPGPQTNLNGEIYSPPYLFNNQGGPIGRPSFVSIAAAMPYASNVYARVDTGGAGDIVRATLVKTGAVTHSFNMEQRFIELPITRRGNSLVIRTPANSKIATPGYYYLFLIGTNGAPSEARIVRLDRQLSANTAAAENLVSDSSFEAVVGVRNRATETLSRRAYFGGWEVLSGTVAIIHDNHRNLGRPASGSVNPGGKQVLSLTGTSPGRIRQVVDGLKVGATYELTFKVAKHSAYATARGNVRIGSLNRTVSHGTNGDQRWGTRSFTFTANRTSLPLTFAATGTDSALLIDDVTIAELQ